METAPCLLPSRAPGSERLTSLLQGRCWIAPPAGNTPAFGCPARAVLEPWTQHPAPERFPKLPGFRGAHRSSCELPPLSFFPGPPHPQTATRGEGLPKLALSPSFSREGPLGQGSVLAVGNRKGETRSPGKPVVHLMNWGAPFRETCRRVYTMWKTRVREG